MTAKIEIYATSYCRYCMDARELLQAKGIEYDEYLLDLMPLEKNVMIERCGQKSVPQIFIDGVHIGGLAELLVLDDRGELGKFLNKNQAD